MGILTSGPYSTVTAAIVGGGATVWTIVAAYRVVAALVRGRYKRSADDHQRRPFGFWLGALVSFVGLLGWVWSGLTRIDL